MELMLQLSNYTLNFFALHFFFQHGIMITKEEMDARLSEEQDEINQDIMVYLKCF
jgi:hypothetical protein